MNSRWRKRLLLVAVAALPGACLYDRSSMIRWVGSVELLEVDFAVTDAATGQPVPGARVEILSEGGFPDDRDGRGFVLVTSPGGIARKQLPDWTCAGKTSGLGFTDTFSLRPVTWWVRATADGHEPGGWTGTWDLAAETRKPQQTGPRRYKLVFPISLTKNGG